MNPRCIILKTRSVEFLNAFIYKLKEIKNIRFFDFKINGWYTVVIKCHNYYNRKNILTASKLYGSYIFLYSIISIIISELLIAYYEHSISRRIIHIKKEKKLDIHKLSNISSLLLDEYSPFDFSRILYKKRKNILLENILKNFRKRNYIYIDNFIDFFAKDYSNELAKIIDVAIEILFNKSLYDYMMNFIFK